MGYNNGRIRPLQYGFVINDKNEENRQSQLKTATRDDDVIKKRPDKSASAREAR